jgi:peptidoglycan hydrolase CwlO-like protein
MMDGLPAEDKNSVKCKQIFLSLSVIGLLGGFAQARPHLQSLAREMQQTKSSLEQDEIRQRKILSALYAINNKIKKIASEKSTQEQDRIVAESGVQELGEQIADLEFKINQLKTQLRSRLAVMSRVGGQGVLRLLFSSSSSADLERNMRILSGLAGRDLQLIREYTEARKVLAQRKLKLGQRLAHLEGVKQKINAQEQRLLSENQVKRKILDKVKQSQLFALGKYKELRRRSQFFAKEEDSGVFDFLFQPSFFEQKNTLPRPIEGTLAQGFGLIRDPAHGVVLSHRGHFYAAQ